MAVYYPFTFEMIAKTSDVYTIRIRIPQSAYSANKTLATLTSYSASSTYNGNPTIYPNDTYSCTQNISSNNFISGINDIYVDLLYNGTVYATDHHTLEVTFA